MVFVTKDRNCIGTHLICSKSNCEERASWIYGDIQHDMRRISWQHLMRLVGSVNLPCLCIGDFNEIASKDEKSGGRRIRGELKAFQELTNSLHLMDVGFSGPRYTWCNSRDGESTVKEH